MSHNPSCLFLVPSNTFLLCLNAYNFSLSRSTLQSSSHSCPNETNEELVNSGSIRACFADSDRSLDKGIRPECVGYMTSEFGKTILLDVVDLTCDKQYASCSRQ